MSVLGPWERYESNFYSKTTYPRAPDMRFGPSEPLYNRDNSTDHDLRPTRFKGFDT